MNQNLIIQNLQNQLSSSFSQASYQSLNEGNEILKHKLVKKKQSNESLQQYNEKLQKEEIKKTIEISALLQTLKEKESALNELKVQLTSKNLRIEELQEEKKKISNNEDRLNEIMEQLRKMQLLNTHEKDCEIKKSQGTFSLL